MNIKETPEDRFRAQYRRYKRAKQAAARRYFPGGKRRRQRTVSGGLPSLGKRR
jgi:hypothetical protein